MQRVSAEYRLEQNEYLRQESYVWVYLGVVSKEAQTYAKPNGDFAPFSRERLSTQTREFEAYYATAEENFTRADSSQYFMPRDTSAIGLYQGAVTQDALGSITYTFEPYTRLDIKGLTIDFGDYFPTRFEITNGNPTYTYTYENNQPGKWVTEDIFEETGFIRITPLEMIGGQQKFRIFSILFGVGLMFDNNSLISTSWKSETSHISDVLPSKTFKFTISNLNRNFAADDPHSFLSFLEEQQAVEFLYGRRLDDDTIYTIKGGKLKLKTWSSNDQQAQFSAVGFLDYLSGTYEKGKYYPNGISLYDLAVDVCEDAGITEYIIDNYLKTLITHNPLPVEGHKNLLQLIANASRSIMRETRDGQLEIHSSFEPNIRSITHNGATRYTLLDTLVNEKIKYNEYATAEKNFTYADSSQFFAPRTGTTFIDAGYISEMVSDENGDFTVNPILTLEWETMWTLFNLRLLFSDTIPKSFIVRSYNYDDLIDTIQVDEVDFETNIEANIEHAFFDINKIEIEFTKAKPYQRIHVGRLRFGSVSNYKLYYTDMASSPTASVSETVKDIFVNYYTYSYGTDVVSLGSSNAVVGENTIKFNNPSHDFSLEYKEITDDEETYSKVSKAFVDELPSAENARANTRYFVPNGNRYYMYVVESQSGVKSWNLMSTVTETIVNSLPSTLTQNVLYLVRTAKNLVYHLYMRSTEGTISLGYDVRGTLEIVDSAAYFVTFTSNVEAEVNVKGIQFNVVTDTVSSQVHQIGTDKTSSNVLIDSIEDAQNQAAWLNEYFSNDIDYTISYRGEPALDPDDQIYTENKYVEKNQIRIVDTQIDTSTGMSMNCVLNARRTQYIEVAKVDYAIVDESEVGE